VRLTSFPLIVGMLIAMLLQTTSLAENAASQVHREQTPDEQQLRLEREQAKKLNQERHASLKRDTDKLLKLSTELKDYVDKSSENLLSVDVVKKAEDIEKLAHNVKEKMKGY